MNHKSMNKGSGMASFEDRKVLEKFILDLQKYLKTKLQPCENDKGDIDYWTCGMDHFMLPPDYEPVRYFMSFCKRRRVDWLDMKERIEDYSQEYIICDCNLVNDVSVKVD